MTAPTSAPVGLECAEHPETAAIGRCAVCGRPVCGHCSVGTGADLFCLGTDHRSTSEHWTLIHRSTFEFEADIVIKNLSLQGVESKVFSSRAFKLTLGEDADHWVQVYVRKEQLARAHEVLSLLDLGNGKSTTNESPRH